MQFAIKAYKQQEFQDTFFGFAKELKMNPGMLTFHRDGEKVVAIVQDNVIEKLTDEQLAELKTI